MKNKKLLILYSTLLVLTACTVPINNSTVEPVVIQNNASEKLPLIQSNQTNDSITKFVDENGEIAYIPKQFKVSDKQDEQKIASGLVVIGPDGSEFVWIPTTKTKLERREFGRYFAGGSSIADFSDETHLDSYQDMVSSTEKYGGFYIGRYEASRNADNLPVSKRVTPNETGSLFAFFSPQDATIVSSKVYADNDSVQGFFPWGINWDTMLQWIVDTGGKTSDELKTDSSSWGNYTNDPFSIGAVGNYTGYWEETKANNIYDLAGNNWEWTQERNRGSNYANRGGGYNLMGGPCLGNLYPAALRNGLPGNSNHPNIVFRLALHLK